MSQRNGQNNIVRLIPVVANMYDEVKEIGNAETCIPTESHLSTLTDGEFINVKMVTEFVFVKKFKTISVDSHNEFSLIFKNESRVITVDHMIKSKMVNAIINEIVRFADYNDKEIITNDTGDCWFITKE